jgi:hypothetical protein
MTIEYSETGLKKGRSRAQRSLDLIEAMRDAAEAAQPITGAASGTNSLLPVRTAKKIETSRVSWGTQHIDETADEALAEPSDSTMTNDAVEFLQIVLSRGPMRVADIEQEAREARVLGDDQQLGKSKPFQSAKKILGVTAHKDGLAEGWKWSLPSKASLFWLM